MPHGTGTSSPLSHRGGQIMRLRGLIRKEFLQILRDPSAIIIAFLMPVVLLLLFGYGVSLDADHVPVAIVVDQPSADTADFTSLFDATHYFEPVRFLSVPEAEEALMERRVDGIIHLRDNFSAKLAQPDGTPVQLIVNGVDANTARIISGYVTGAMNTWVQKRAIRSAQSAINPVEVQQRVWYNSELRSRNFLVPGLIAVIMTLIGALLTAMVMAREWERGTMEALLITPVAMTEILLGKIISYFILGMGGMTLSVLMAVWLFEVPLRGSTIILFAVASLFMLAALGMGLFISTVARDQFLAGQMAIVVTFLPAFILSGFIFDIHSMPLVVQAITHIIPARYFVALLQTLFLAGDIWVVIWPNALALFLMATFFLTLSRVRSRKRLQ